MGHTLQLSNKWKLLLLLWPVCLVTFLLFNVTYTFSHCYLTVCDLDSKFPEGSCSMAPGAVSSQNIGYCCLRPKNRIIQVSLPCFPQRDFLLRWPWNQPSELFCLLNDWLPRLLKHIAGFSRMQWFHNTFVSNLIEEYECDYVYNKSEFLSWELTGHVFFLPIFQI